MNGCRTDGNEKRYDSLRWIGVSIGSRKKSFKEITGYLIFDIKLGEGFRRKARWVADGHKTPSPA